MKRPQVPAYLNFDIGLKRLLERIAASAVKLSMTR